MFEGGILLVACEREPRATCRVDGRGVTKGPVLAMSDDFDVFGEAVTLHHKVSVLPRASAHPHFAHWPVLAPRARTSLTEACDALRNCAADSEPCVKELRKSQSQYGRACAGSLRHACEIFCARGAGAADDLTRHAQAVVDLCACAIEESNWDTPAWQEANVLALCFLLAARLADGGDTNGAETEPIGKSATHLLNLWVSAVSPLPAETSPKWKACVVGLLDCVESTICAAWPVDGSKEAVYDLDFAWRIPTEPPGHGLTPTLSPEHMVKTVNVEEMPHARFFSAHLQCGEPVLIRGHLHAERWEALEYFKDLRALRADAGDRLVPINLGSPLVEGYAGVVHWPLRKLIEEYLLPSNAAHHVPPDDATTASQAPDEEKRIKVAYMSQHHLLHQQPSLQSLLAVPPHTLGRELSPANMWLGTRGTVTSIHSDPSDNLLCQVAGFKYFRLIALDQTHKLYATTQRANNSNSFGTSPVRPEMPLPPEHALAADVEYVEGILAPGDMLFIPKSMWHYVRSLTTSVSVNFWF